MAGTRISQGVRLGQDSKGFVRRACPVCARHFKIIARAPESLVVHVVFSSLLAHANVDELAGLPLRWCPYCGHRAQADVFLTKPQRSYIEACARSVAGQVRFEQLRQATGRLRDNPYITFLAVRPAEPELDPPAEPDDMTAVFLLCCGEEMKIKPTWKEALLCHHCRAGQPAE